MDISAYVLATRNTEGALELGRERQGITDLPIGFEPEYAHFLFEFGESRIQCQQDEEILLLKGVIDTAGLPRWEGFVDAFKDRLKEPRDYSSWQVIKRKRAMDVGDSRYQHRLMQYLRDKYTGYQADRQSFSAG